MDVAISVLREAAPGGLERGSVLAVTLADDAVLTQPRTLARRQALVVLTGVPDTVDLLDVRRIFAEPHLDPVDVDADPLHARRWILRWDAMSQQMQDALSVSDDKAALVPWDVAKDALFHDYESGVDTALAQVLGL